MGYSQKDIEKFLDHGLLAEHIKGYNISKSETTRLLISYAKTMEKSWKSLKKSEQNTRNSQHPGQRD